MEEGKEKRRRKRERRKHQNEHSWREEALEIKNLNKIDSPRWMVSTS